MTPGGAYLVTGASGFLGGAVLARWQAEGRVVRGVVRGDPCRAGCLRGPELMTEAAWGPLLAGCEAVVHAAARVHVMAEEAADPLSAFRAVNVAGTLNLARQAAEAGVRRFVFLSSIKVLGEFSQPGRPFLPDDALAPRDPYSISKAEAEAGLMTLAARTGMELVIIRPPLVYGPGVKANFLAMMRWLRRGVPLPFGAVCHNRRSLVALDNLVDLIATCVIHPAAANQVVLAGDGEDLSTADLLRRLAAAMGVPARLVPVPVWLLEAAMSAVGRGGWVERLCGNLQVDISKAQRLLGWRPEVSVDEGLRRAAAGFEG